MDYFQTARARELQASARTCRDLVELCQFALSDTIEHGAQHPTLLARANSNLVEAQEMAARCYCRARLAMGLEY